MEFRYRGTFALVLVALLSGCGNEGDSNSATNSDQAARDQAANPTVAPGSTPAVAAAETDAAPDPCALLTDAVIRSVFSVPADATIENPPTRNPVRATCTYIWDKPNADEIRQEIQALQQQRVRDMMKQARRGKIGQGMMDMAMNMPRVENRVHLNFGNPAESPAAARATFDSAIQMLERGLTHTIEVDEDTPGTTRAVREHLNGQEVTFQASATPVEGLGDAARWIPRLNQIAVLDGQRILFLTVEIEVDRDVNLEHAKRLARALLD